MTRSFYFFTSAVSVVFYAAQAPAQLMPTVSAISGGVGNSLMSSIAPGEIVTIAGSNLAQASANMAGNSVPTTMGGVQVAIGGKSAPLFMVSPTQIVAQVPYEVALGMQNVTVMSGSVSSAATNVTVAAVAPAWFADSSGALVVRASNNSLRLWCKRRSSWGR